jgi:hypothetical protein
MDRSAVGVLVRGVMTTTALAASALSPVGWWLDWQGRARAGQGGRPLD